VYPTFHSRNCALRWRLGALMDGGFAWCDALLAALNSGQQALASGDTNAAIQHFTAMQQILLAGTHDGTINAGVMVEIMKRIQSLAKSHGLTLPLSIQFD
jgi:hypothetical protein